MLNKMRKWLKSIDISFYRWPPVVSHLMAFVLGILTMSYEKKHLVSFTSRPGEVMIHPSKALARKIKQSQVAHHAYLIKSQPKAEPCLWQSSPISLIWDDQQNVKIVVRTKELSEQLIKTVKPRGGKYIKFFPNADFKPCLPRGRVVYE